MKRIDFYKWCYERGGFWGGFYDYLTMFVRMPFYVFTGRPEKSHKMIQEHMNWKSKETPRFPGMWE